MCDLIQYRELAFLLTGAFIGAIATGLVGLFFGKIQRRRDTVKAFRAMLHDLSTRRKLDTFHRDSCDAIARGTAQLRPIISAKKIAACDTILREYEGIPEREMDQQSTEYAAKMLGDMGRDAHPDKRFKLYVDRFEKELA